MKYIFLCLTSLFTLFSSVKAQTNADGNEKKLIEQEKPKEITKNKPLYGLASYYADKFNGKPTASGELYDYSKFTAACNVLPLGTWIRVTNLSNNRSVIVRTNDRLHVKMKRLVDLSRTAAEQLGYTKKGLTQVKVDVLKKEERNAVAGAK